MKYYIAYGSNLNVDQMIRRCPDAVVVGTSTVKDHKLVFRGNSRSGVANIEPCAGESVPVGIWAISAADERSLDRYEGYPWLYTKQEFTLTVRRRTITAMAYIMTPGRKVASPNSDYLYTIAQGYGDFGFDLKPLEQAVEHAHRRIGA